MHIAGLVRAMIRQDYLRMVATPAFVRSAVTAVAVAAFQFIALDIRILAEADPPAAARAGTLFAAASGTYTYHLPPSALCYIAMQRLQVFWLVVPLLAPRVVATDARSGYRCLRAARGATPRAQALAAVASSAMVSATLFAVTALAMAALCTFVSCGSDTPGYYAAMRDVLVADLPASMPPPLYPCAGAYRLAIVGVLLAASALGALSAWISFCTASATAPAALGSLCALSPYIPIYALNGPVVQALLALGLPADLTGSVDLCMFGAGFPVPGALAPNLSAWVASAAWLACEVALLASGAYAFARARERGWGR